ncbi:OmpA family protein [uncultured Microbulbifer sp.]|uniref:OmpA family protein n=1 Tax=uncultured Microbulbifer sp. TaxID=348147 RepID=UPI00261CB6E6|nr:OmpA family protein [uncultured Microbulbifer sp.]
MAENLLELAASQLGASGIGTLASELDLPADKGQSALDTGVAFVLAGMLNKASSKTGMAYLFNLITGSEAADLTDITNKFSNREKLASTLPVGTEMLQKVFGTRVEEVTKVATTEVPGNGGGRLLKLVLPLVAALLGAQVKSQKMDVSDLASFLIGQREFLRNKIPDALLDALDVQGFDELGASLVTHGHAKPQEPREQALHGSGEKKKPVSFSSWFFPLLLVLVALYALNMCMDKGRQERPADQPLETPQEQAFMESPSQSGDDTTLTDRNAQAQLGPDKFTSNLSDYLKSFDRDPNQEFPLEVKFEARTAKILNPNAADIRALAKIMQENPKLTVAIEGHVQGEGNEIREQEISQERADVVREILLQKGIAANRITATGMGSAKPLAGDEPEQNTQKKTQNERISVRVVTTQ